MRRVCVCSFMLFALTSLPAFAADVGRIKTSTGAAHIERAGQRLPAAVDTPVRASDTVVTGANGSVGMTFIDNTRLAAGPNTTLVLSQYSFDQTTHVGRMDTQLKRGTLAIVSGRMVKGAPEAMTVTTPSVVLGVRGTEFVVSAE